MKTYIFTLQSDQGKTKYQTLSTSIEQATKTCLKANLCPESAIINIKIK